MQKIKLLFTMVVTCLATLVANAQNPLKIGEKQLNAGLNFFSNGLSIYGGVDYSIHEDITMGGELALLSSKTSFVNGEIKSQGVAFVFNGNYHFNRLLKIADKWDTYAGLNLNYVGWNNNIVDYSNNDIPNYNGPVKYSSGLGLDFQIGGRYYFNERFGVNLELGGMAFSSGKVGVSYKF